ncbi:AcrR family transcriptional regulator [Thermocatellispora tengchongensis]|uniref:AcrR family transcriptional regulator n=1 Tax=Thermocatellispora tengchongensis TaxID=1073253 RepID=A0A840PHU8_9ACTN|nr:TetR/AcrR family transcriptional regulator [Thermocatellispora tengchongensis]MBB5138549.1 AcrR family transcriptional regulator [Thermocatellispora tengchongensis]
MTTEQTSGGDPKRSIELLWGLQDSRPKRGPKPRFTVAGIARVAIEIADAEGLAALSMRRVADKLGVTAMSLYTYVPGKAELIDVMLDTVIGETLVEEDPAAEEGWRARLARIARQSRDLYLRHPWLLQVVTTVRPVLGPNMIAKYDRDLRAVDGLGLTDIEMDLVVTLVSDYVHGAVRTAVEQRQVERDTGKTDEQWWQEWAPLLEKVFDADRHPTAARVGAAAGAAYNAAAAPDRAFEFGLQRILDGIEHLIARA